MTDHERLQAAYAAKRPKLAPAAPQVVTRTIRHIGGAELSHPLTVTYRADMEAETAEMLKRAGMTWAGDDLRQAGSWW
jgi:hypothetical protein